MRTRAVHSRPRIRPTVQEAVDRLSDAFREHPSYALIWYTNLTICIEGEVEGIDAASRAAKRFLKMTFGYELE